MGNSEVAFLIPRLWVQGVAAEGAGPCWAGIVIHDTAFLSIHPLEHCIEGGRGEALPANFDGRVDGR